MRSLGEYHTENNLSQRKHFQEYIVRFVSLFVFVFVFVFVSVFVAVVIKIILRTDLVIPTSGSRPDLLGARKIH